MKYYTSTTEFNCGIDLHARQMYVCVMDRQGKKLVHSNIRNNDFEYFLKLVAPYRHELTVCCECMFGWYAAYDPAILSSKGRLCAFPFRRGFLLLKSAFICVHLRFTRLTSDTGRFPRLHSLGVLCASV